MSWDDGKHTKVKRVQLTYDNVVYSIQVTYDGNTFQSPRHGSVGPKYAEFTFESDEYLKALTAYGKTFGTHNVITALTFTTNKRTYGPYGNKSCFQLSALEVTGKQIAGFLGSSGNVLNSIDVHYAPVATGTSTSTGSQIGSAPQKFDAQGGVGGTEWDDGSDHDGVTKIYVRSGALGIQFVKFEYVKDEKLKQGSLHGEQSRGSTKEIVINHPNEYLVSVESLYDSSNVIQGIQFKTNQKTSDYIGYDDFDGNATKFTLQVQDKKIIGFHGFSSNHLYSIGAYFVPLASTIPPQKLEAQGGETGLVWDDGPHDNVRKVYVGLRQDGLGAVKFEYTNGCQVVFGIIHGKKSSLGYEKFELDSDEYITSVEGTYGRFVGSDSVIVTTLTFKTNKNKIAGPFGIEGSSKFALKEEGYKIVGFHGRDGNSINAIGAYLAPLGTIPLTKCL